MYSVLILATDHIKTDPNTQPKICTRNVTFCTLKHHWNYSPSVGNKFVELFLNMGITMQWAINLNVYYIEKQTTSKQNITIGYGNCSPK